MRKRPILFVSVPIILTMLLLGCDKTEDQTPRPASGTTYTVTYGLELSGEYDDFLLMYNLAGSTKEIKSSITHPWQVSFENFNEGDTVFFDFRLKTRPFKETAYQYSVTVEKDDDYIAGISGSQSLSPGDTTINIHVSWLKVIGS